MGTGTLVDVELAVSRLSEVGDDVAPAGPGDHVGGVPAAVVVRPVSTEQTAQLLRVAAQLELTVVARGAGTRLGWGAPPRRVDLLVDLTRMSAVLDHAAGDLVVVAQAGCPVATLNEAVASAGQRLALDDAAPGSTLGGSVATNSSGPRRMRDGTLRDLMIGTTVVRADGVVAHSGGRVVKNVAGYDLGKLMTGSFGTLAVITEAVFRLHPLPAAARTVSVPVSMQTLPAVLAALVHSDVAATAIEVDAAGGGLTVAVLIEGTDSGVRSRAGEARDLIRAAGAEPSGDDEPPPWWGRQPWRDGDVALKLTCALSGVPGLIAEAQRRDCDVRGSAGTGVLYGRLVGTSADRVAETVRGLRESCLRRGGSLVVLDGPAALTAGLDRWGPVSALALMRAVKDQFDPEHRLAPGRFVGGI
ncbi:MAG: FAD-binding oxidoreductase [Geodermatophilaceae bacterium]|nr:FAD-binding oxidoreductase [Geodermatophilaceae bacterium]